MTRVSLLTVLLTLTMAADSESALPQRICMSMGSAEFGVVGMVFYSDGRSLKIDSPRPGNPNSRITRWSQPGYAEELWKRLEPVLNRIPADSIDQCDEDWRDTILVDFGDDSPRRWDASCQGNDIQVLRTRLAEVLPAFAEDPSTEEVETALEGIDDPCSREW